MNKIKEHCLVFFFNEKGSLFLIELFSVFFDIIETLIRRIGREDESFTKWYE